MLRMNLSDAVAEAAVEGAALSRAKGIALDTRLPDAPVWVSGDVQALRRLFLILIDNAVKYTPAGGRCEVALEQREGLAIGTVRDNGIGISREDAARVFGMFSRLERSVEGSGIGLAVCRRVVEAHGGHIWVEPADGGGSAFRFTLPVAPEP